MLLEIAEHLSEKQFKTYSEKIKKLPQEIQDKISIARKNLADKRFAVGSLIFKELNHYANNKSVYEERMQSALADPALQNIEKINPDWLSNFSAKEQDNIR